MTKKELQKINNKVNAEMREISEIIDPIVGRLYDRLDDLQEEKGDSSEQVAPTCGNARSGANNKKSAATTKRATEAKDEIIDQIKQNPHIFKEVGSISTSSTDISSGGEGGSERGYVHLAPMGTPKWVKELKEITKGFVRGKKQRSKEYYDPEDLIRGVLSKQSAKKTKREQYVYTVLDTSGSMSSSSGVGRVSFLELMMKQIPPIVREYEGEVVLCDTEIHYPIYTNKQIRKALDETGKLGQAGGGATDFDEAYIYIIDQLEEIKKTKPNAEALVITLTDAGVRWNLDYIKELKNFIVVTTLKESRNVKVISDEFPEKQYPNVRNIFIR